eukprot:1178373-Prorocentrum_minimum.AAC.1
MYSYWPTLGGSLFLAPLARLARHRTRSLCPPPYHPRLLESVLRCKPCGVDAKAVRCSFAPLIFSSWWAREYLTEISGGSVHPTFDEALRNMLS